ncbi:MAG: hypothetical protein ACJ8EY_04460 [Sphingomicrobium sp.]
MNPFEMVVLIVAIVMIASVLKSRGQGRVRYDRQPENPAENQRLRQEVQELKDRIKVLERITVDKENTLARQIDELRDR